ncbi:MAG: hypothetical protein M3008_11790 [Chloroflexota bacterium]|nr:hypothetical protein [Chloroflexota bacterium]
MTRTKGAVVTVPLPGGGAPPGGAGAGTPRVLAGGDGVVVAGVRVAATGGLFTVTDGVVGVVGCRPGGAGAGGAAAIGVTSTSVSSNIKPARPQRRDQPPGAMAPVLSARSGRASSPGNAPRN